MKTPLSIRIAFFFFISILAVSCHRDSDVLQMTFSKVEKCMDLLSGQCSKHLERYS